MNYYLEQQPETKIDYMRIVLQGLLALLLVSLIVLAWSVRSWFLSRAEQNLAERQATPAATLNAAVKADMQQQPPSALPAPPQITLAQPVQAPAAVPAPATVAPSVAVAAPAAAAPSVAAPPPVAAPAPVAEPQSPAPPRQEAKAYNAVLTTTLDQALANLEQQSAARQAQSPAIDPQSMRTAAKPVTKEDVSYVSALGVQYQDRGTITPKLSDEELARRLNAGTQSQASQGKAVDTTNKVLIAAANGQGYQGELDALVAASLQRIKDEKAGVAAPAAGYLQGLQQEATVRENEARTYVVQAGDTLSHISARSYGSGTQYMKIFRANPTLITDPNRIYIGMVLRVPL